MRATLSLLIFATACPALGAQVQFESTVCFGDSLTHNDILSLASGVPQAIYGTDPMQAAFFKGRHPGDQLVSYALAGSESDDLIFQAGVYGLDVILGSQEPATLVSIEIGGNDIRNNRALLASHPVGTNAAADAVIDNVIEDIALVLIALDNGTRQFIVWTIPDITNTPSHWTEFTAGQEANIRRHTARLNKSINRLADLPNYAVFRFCLTLRSLALDPPALNGALLVGPPTWGDYDHIFGDELHPSAVANAYYANGIISVACQSFGGCFFGYSEAELAALAHL